MATSATHWAGVFLMSTLSLYCFEIFFKGIATGMRFALSFKADQFSVQCGTQCDVSVCVNPSRAARAQSKFSPCWVDQRPNMHRFGPLHIF